MRKRKYHVVALILVMSLLSGCIGQTDKSQSNQNNKKIQIGFSFYSLVIERWQRDRDVFVSKAQELEASVNTQNANGSLTKQKEQIQYLIDEGMDVIVIVASDTKNLSDSVKAAKAKGIRVIAYDRLIENVDLDLFVTFDSETIGKLMGHELTKQFPNGANLLEIFGSPTDHNVELMEKGVTNEIAHQGFQVLDKVYAKNWLAEYAFTTVSNCSEKVDAIICGNDDLAAQAIKALSEKRMAGKVYVIGQDADLAACQRIVEGTQAGTIFKNVDTMAKKAAQAAVSLAKGEKITSDGTLQNGSKKVPYLYLQPTFVNKKNIDKTIIASGFHTKEDVYMNE